MDEIAPVEKEELKTITIFNRVTHKYETWDPFIGELVGSSVDDELPEAMLKGFTLEKAQAISALVREGLSIAKISKLASMPSLQILYHWKRHMPEFARLLKEAREDRADLLFERYMELAEDADEYSDAELRAIKIRIDAWRWAAEKLAPKEYGGQKEREDTSAPLQISIYTGIVREDPVTVTVHPNGAHDG